MTLNAITHAVGALKMVPMHLNHPTIVSRSTLIGATTEALSMLEGLPPVTAELAEVFRMVESVLLKGQVAYVTPTRCPERPYGAVVADTKGRLCATATGKSKEGLVELIRLQLVPQEEGHGEDAA
ncbi:hypothetical protein GIV21_04450 [Pseudomonas syringae]|uniref:hypothetical protein n=1 Tax=Pseudomonas syringae group TaxID=136849 RepID=UPI002EB534AC|nr:hypothetical protein [Pseudomonas syringae]MEE4139235.1 hypothetical protein [Pseudomonas viridiflava]